MSLTRRTILVTGGAAVVVAGAGFAFTRAPRQAREPWRSAGESFGDPRLDALAYAILAPNPHNMQPWQFRLEGEDTLTVFARADRMLPQTDPQNRQITIGFGCLLELLRQAAAEKGWRAETAYFPDGEPQPALDARAIARVRFVKEPGAAKDTLFGAVLERRTNRAPFDERPLIDGGDLSAILGAGVPGVSAGATKDPARVAQLRRLAADAWAVEWSTDFTRGETIAVTRIGKAAINAQPFGIALPGAMIDAAHMAGMLTKDAMDQPGSTAYEQSFDFYDHACRTAQGFLWAVTATNTRRDQLETGRAWVRMHLAATRAGLACHPLSQALQEFPEMSALYARAHEILAPGGGVVQMLARLGHAGKAPAAPREPLQAKLIDA